MKQNNTFTIIMLELSFNNFINQLKYFIQEFVHSLLKENKENKTKHECEMNL